MTEPEKRPQPRTGYRQNRRDKVRAEIERNRRGDYVVPTWVFVVALVLVIAGFVSILIFF